MVAVLDTFTRTVTGGWGTADTGQAWTIFGTASDFLVTGGAGVHTQTSVNSARTVLIDSGEIHGMVTVDVRVPVVPAGNAITTWVLARANDTSNYYTAALSIGTSGAASITLYRRVASVLSSALATQAAIGTHTAGHVWRIRFDVRRLELRAKAWNLNNQTEPASWQVTASDSNLSTGTLVGAFTRLESGNSNTLPVAISLDNFTFTPVVTAAVQDVYPPRVLVSVTGLTVGDEVQVYRIVAGEQTLLRAGSSDSVTDSSFLVVDAELPFGVPVSYRAVVNGSSALYISESTTYELPGGKVVITDAINGSAAEVVILAWPEQNYQRQSSVFRVGGRTVVVSGDMGMFEGQLELLLDYTSSVENLMELLRDATSGVVQIRQLGGYADVDSYVAVLGVTKKRYSQDGSDERRTIVLDVAEVDGWPPALEPRGFTYADLEAAYTGLTYADLNADYSTYLRLAQADLS